MSVMYRKNNYGVVQSMKLQSPDDAPMLVFVAMFDSMCQDLAVMRTRGMWKHNPKEAIGHPLIDMLLHTEGPITGRLVLKEYLSDGLKHLSLLIDTASGGRVKIGPSSAVRWAKKISEDAPNHKRCKL